MVTEELKTPNLVGILILSYYRTIKNLKYIFAIGISLFVSIMVLSALYPSLITKSIERASTTLDFEQSTYQGRWQNIPKIIRLSTRYPVMGIPFGKHKSADVLEIETEIGFITDQIVVTPHNLLLEWLYHFGFIGLCIGILILVSSFVLIFQFLKKYQGEEEMFNWGVSLFSAWVFTLFYALCNVTTTSQFSVFFLYFPLVLLMTVHRISKKSAFPTNQKI